MKKLKIIILLITICFSLCFLLNSIYVPNAYAAADMYEGQGINEFNVTENQMTDMTQDGKITVSGEGEGADGKPPSSTEDIDVAEDGWGGVGGFLTSILSIFAFIINWILSLAAGKPGTRGDEAEVGTKFTIQNLLAGRYPLFDINYFAYVGDDKNTATNGFNSTDNFVETKQQMANAMAIWFVALRNLAIIGLVVVLIYIGIRMAIETAASEQARYKQMALYWLEGISLLLVLHYLIIFVLNIADLVQKQLVAPLYNTTVETSADDGKKVFNEVELMNGFWSVVQGSGGTNSKLYNLVLIYAFTYFQFKFFLLYLFRSIRVYFYIIISPLVCLTYPLDKLGDTKAQAFNTLTGMFISDVMLQIYHCIMYVALIYTAGAIIEKIPILGLVFIFLLGKADKIMADVLHVKVKGLDSVKLNPMDMVPKRFGHKKEKE